MKTYVVNLPKDKERRAFQEKQLQYFGIDYTFVHAVSTDDISEQRFVQHQYDWQRPLRKVEVACYYSHRILWKKIIETDEPALILEDDALLSRCLPEILSYFSTVKNIDYINLEVVGRKKLLAKKAEFLPMCHTKLYRLYLDRNGTGGYILYPSGAQKLLDLEMKIGIGLADAHINACTNLAAYQIEPAAVIQLDQCEKLGIIPPLEMSSNIGVQPKPVIPLKDSFYFKVKRISAQIKQAIQHVKYFFRATKKHADIRKEDFIFSKNKRG